MFEIPPLFDIIQKESGTEWKEMYKVFNMGHRFEIYTDAETALEIIKISESFNVEAKIVGRVEASQNKKLSISSRHGDFIYE
jgi:phosphoribosylformylglycinamidine cyclo-ligase